MSEFENKLKSGKADPEIKLFKDCVRKVVLEKIDELNKYVQ